MEKRVEIVLKGRVQKAGYRDYIDEVAFDLDIKGWVKNLEDGTVKVVCEGRSKDIEEFINRIKIHEYPIRVDDVIVEYFPATGEFKDFTIIREEDIVFATYERMDAAGRYMREMNKNLGSKLDKMVEKQDRMLEKQDTTIQILKNASEELRSVHEDTTDMKSTLSRIESDVKDTKFSLSSFIEEKYQKLEGEIAEIKATLARTQEAG
jgi:acylphosphatase